jgi:hypothetical protein
MTTRTEQTLTENLDLREASMRTLKVIEVQSQTDDGEWRTSTFANEPAAVAFEIQMGRRGVFTRRPA